jgi:translation initiation factor IF-2
MTSSRPACLRSAAGGRSAPGAAPPRCRGPPDGSVRRRSSDPRDPGRSPRSRRRSPSPWRPGCSAGPPSTVGRPAGWTAPCRPVRSRPRRPAGTGRRPPAPRPGTWCSRTAGSARAGDPRTPARSSTGGPRTPGPPASPGPPSTRSRPSAGVRPPRSAAPPPTGRAGAPPGRAARPGRGRCRGVPARCASGRSCLPAELPSAPPGRPGPRAARRGTAGCCRAGPVAATGPTTPPALPPARRPPGCPPAAGVAPGPGAAGRQGSSGR